MNWPFQKAARPVQPPMPVSEKLAPHPFYPLGIELVDYVANDRDVATMLAIFFGGWAVILGAVWISTSRFSPQTKLLDKLILLWFFLTGTIHFFFEGYFAYNHGHMAGAQDLFGQLWKEYAMSDSRYLTSDPFVLCMETVTAAAWGPMSYVTVYLIAAGHPLRYPIQAIVSLGQIYGDILYYATSMFDLYYKDLVYCRPEAYYFWFYFFFMNFIWIVIPGFLLYQSVSKSAEAFKALNQMGKAAQGNGIPKPPNANAHIKKQ